MSGKKIRIFAGANGSGKSTFIKTFEDKFKAKLHTFVNADEIEATLNKKRELNFFNFNLEVTTSVIQNYFKKSTFSPIKLKKNLLYESFFIENNILKIEESLNINSYIAADIAEFIRQSLEQNNQSFSYETVMSNSNKIDFLKNAKNNGYKIYLYYFTTIDPQINIQRVKLRVSQGGHDVPENTIINRYYKSLELIDDAIKTSNSAYLFDTTNYTECIAKISEGNKFELLIENENIPEWVSKYVLKLN